MHKQIKNDISQNNTQFVSMSHLEKKNDRFFQ